MQHLFSLSIPYFKLIDNNDNKQVTGNAGRVEVGHPVLGADRLRPGRRASTVVVASRPRVNV